jgi:plasmid stabilization system protein ParE
VPADLVHLTQAAADDLDGILGYTEQHFGSHQRDRYARLISHALNLLVGAPERPGVRRRSELGDGVRAFHLDHAARRPGAAAHVVYFMTGPEFDGRAGIVVLRVLHAVMDPSKHLADRS